MTWDTGGRQPLTGHVPLIDARSEELEHVASSACSLSAVDPMGGITKNRVGTEGQQWAETQSRSSRSINTVAAT